MLIHTQKGIDIFEKIKDKFYVVYAPVNVVAEGISDTVYENEKKEEFIKDYNSMSMVDLLDKWFPMSNKVILKKCVRRILNKFSLDLFVKKIKRKINKVRI